MDINYSLFISFLVPIGSSVFIYNNIANFKCFIISCIICTFFHLSGTSVSYHSSHLAHICNLQGNLPTLLLNFLLQFPPSDVSPFSFNIQSCFKISCLFLSNLSSSVTIKLSSARSTSSAKTIYLGRLKFLLVKWSVKIFSSGKLCFLS